MKEKSFTISMLGVFIFAFFILMPMLHSGYTNDDSVYSFLFRGSSIEKNISIMEIVLTSIKTWLVSTGRFFPLSDLSMLAVIYTNLFTYKIIVLLTILANIYLFGYLIKNLTGSESLSLLSVLVTPILFQIRLNHDPILGYYIIQLTTLFMLISLNLFVLFLINRKLGPYLLALLFYIISLLTYEITYPFFVFYFILALGYSRKKSNAIKSIKVAIPFFAAPVAGGLINLFLRFFFGWGITNTTYAFNPALNIYPFTVIKQSFAAIPLVYYIVDPQNIFRDTTKDLANIISVNSVFIFIIYLVIFTYLSKSFLDELSIHTESINMNILLSLGLSFLVLPSILVSLVPTYQKYVINWGSGYIPVFVSYFGFMFIFIYFICILMNNIRTGRINIPIILIVALLVATVGTINYNNNNLIIKQSNEFWLYPRALIEDGIKSGLFNEISNNSTLLVDNADTYIHPWDGKTFYLMMSGIRFRYVWSSGRPLYVFLMSDDPYHILPRAAFVKDYKNRHEYNLASFNNISYIKYGAKSDSDGYAILSPSIKNLIISNDTIYNATSDYAYIYIKSSNIGLENQAKHIEIHGHWVNGLDSSIRPFILDESSLDPLSYSKDWILFRLHMSDKLLDLRSLSIDIFPGNGEKPIS